MPTRPPASRKTGPPSAPWLAAALFALTLVAYLPALRAGFIWDDDAYVTQNATLRDASGLRQIWFDAAATPQYYPLVHTGFWIEYHLWGLHPAGFHAVNIGLHALAAILLWRALARLQLPGAWLAAAIFAVHPVGVESVAWITERKNVLSAVFYFAAALAYLRFEAWRDAGKEERRRAYFYLGALALFAAALLSKTVTCSLPAALLLARWWKKGRVEARDVLPLAPFFAAGLGLGLLTVWLEQHHVGAQGSGWSLSVAQRGLVAGRALWFYAGKLFWPHPLTFVYSRWEPDPRVAWQWFFPAAAIAVVAILWRARKRIGRGPLAAVLFFAGTLGPALGFVNVYPFRYSFVADHFQYLAGIGLIALVAAGLSRWPRVIPGALVALLAALAWKQCGIYRDRETLWRDTLAKHPDCWLAHNNLGIELEGAGNYAEAYEHYVEAIALDPRAAEAYNNLGNVLMQAGRVHDASENYRKALDLDPNLVDALNSFGATLAMDGDYDGAIRYFRRAIQLRPNYARAHGNLGNALKAQLRVDDAIREYSEALRLAPNDASTLNNVGLLLEQKGRLPEALGYYERSLAANPRNAGAHLNLGRALAELGRLPEAKVHAREALQLQPDYANAKQLLQELEAMPAPEK